MENDIYKNAINNLSVFFDLQLDSDSRGAEFFEPLKELIPFDECYIFYLNPDDITLRFSCSKVRRLSINDSILVDLEAKNDLFSLESLIFDTNNKLFSLFNLSDNKSFMISKLIIKNNVYGFMLFCKSNNNFYDSSHLEISSVISSIISYKIKDLELSEIFKIQIKALKDSFIETQAAYKTIQEQNVKILEADKVKNEFLANISHELRTPLNAIIGFSEILSTEHFGALNKKQKDYINDIHLSGIHLLGMINEILDISKLEANAMTLNKTEFEISRAVNEVFNVIQPLAVKKDIILKKNLKNDFVINVDFQKLKQILYNLLSNAIKFTPECGLVSVDVSFSDNCLVVLVNDTGIGIDKKDQQRIFDKFVQLESAYTKTESSTGLGLTITKEFVEMHGGSITLESEVGKGSEFKIILPLS